MAHDGVWADGVSRLGLSVGRLDRRVRFCLLFTFLLLLSYAIHLHPYASGTFGHQWLKSYLEFSAWASGATLRLLGESVEIRQSQVLGRFSYEVVLDCGALDVQALYALAVLAFPSSLGRKLVGLIGGVFAIWSVNIGRLVGLYYAGASSQRLFEVLHEEVMVLLLVIFVCGMFIAWVGWANRARADEQGSRIPVAALQLLKRINTDTSRRTAKSLTIFIVILGIAGWPWDGVRVGFSRGMSTVANLALEQVDFGRELKSKLEPLPAKVERRPTDHVHADTMLVLRLPQSTRAARFGLSMRRDAYLPMVIFLAFVGAAPLAPKRKLACVAIGVSVIVAVAVASVCLLIAHMMNQLYAGAAPLDWSNALTGFLYERWLLPWGNRVIAPLVLAVGLVLAFRLQGQDACFVQAAKEPSNSN